LPRRHLAGGHLYRPRRPRARHDRAGPVDHTPIRHHHVRSGRLLRLLGRVRQSPGGGALMTVDKILLEVLNNRFTGIVEEMGYVIHRAAFTTFVKETWDFDSALVTTKGEVFAYPRNIGVTNMLSMSMTAAIQCFDSYEPGDVILTNDPLHAAGMCTHLPDYM